MKSVKRVFSSVMVFVMMFSLTPDNLSVKKVHAAESSEDVESAESTKGGTTYIVNAKLQYYIPSGETEGYYQIYSVDDLNMLAKIVNGESVNVVVVSEDGMAATSNITSIPNQDARLMNHIENADVLTAIGNSENGYSGTFDGNGYTISGISGYNGAALFGNIESGATVKNLTLDVTVTGENYSNHNYCYGILAAVNYGTITGCTTKGSLNTGIIENTTTENAYVAGIVCDNYGVIRDCVNEAEFTTANLESVWDDEAEDYTSKYELYTGAICAYNHNNIIDNCANKGNVTVSQCGHGYVAGVVGYSEGSVTDCSNSGTICVDNASLLSKAGIVGVVYGSESTSNINITSCINTGAIAGESAYGGGIVGDSYKGNITNCVNKGVVSGYYYMGGIVSYCEDATIEHCLNRGTVSVSDAEVGGIVSYLATASIVTECVNVANVICEKGMAGGIVGYMEGAKEVSYCSNSGTVYNKDEYAYAYKNCHYGAVGGIVGMAADNERVALWMVV